MLKLGSHVSMSGKDMLLGSARRPFPTVPTLLWSTPVPLRTLVANQSRN